MPETGLALLGASGLVRFMAKQVRLTLAKAIAKANLCRAEVGEKPITMNGLAVAAGVASTYRVKTRNWQIIFFVHALELRPYTDEPNDLMGACPHWRHAYPPRGFG